MPRFQCQFFQRDDKIVMIVTDHSVKCYFAAAYGDVIQLMNDVRRLAEHDDSVHFSASHDLDQAKWFESLNRDDIEFGVGGQFIGGMANNVVTLDMSKMTFDVKAQFVTQISDELISFDL